MKNLKAFLLSLVLCLANISAFWLPGSAIGPLTGADLERLHSTPRRIVSLAPSLTETLFALGAGDLVVGVTAFDHYPPAVERVPRIGGYYDPNYEAILRARPDLVVVLPENSEQRGRLQQMGLRTLTVEQHSLAGILNSYWQLGQICGRPAQAALLSREFKRTLATYRRVSARLERKKVLLVMGRDYSARMPQDIYIAGAGEIFSEVLGLAGGANAYERTWPKYPKISAEGVLSLDPDLVLEMVTDAAAMAKGAGRLRADWERIPGWDRTRRPQRSAEVLLGEYLTIPGPRILQVLAAFGRAIHPEVKWE